MTQTEQLDPDTVARAAARLPAILHPPVSEQVSSPAAPERNRRTRSDAGKPRESFYVSIPGVRFDMSTEEGRAAVKTWIAQQGASPCVDDIIDSLLREIDRLRAK